MLGFKALPAEEKEGRALERNWGAAGPGILLPGLLKYATQGGVMRVTVGLCGADVSTPCMIVF